ncbi:DUF779 domain-containing protein [Mesorhizobium sp. LNHC209A00]|uniref:DUF779 domain-containing protein n=1 Tax=Mesorhizobium sp. LNHC209A00 TaxID=1287226 RepID=UPI0003D026A4|nr:hypothetical protein X738_31250 [Mesorhizobium sp. LNHC209A00]
MHAKVTATPAALELIAEIVADHGPVLFHQSGGCCDGSSPMCYPRADFVVGDRDVLLGHIGDAPFYIGGSQSGPGSIPILSSTWCLVAAVCSPSAMDGRSGS